MNNITKAVLEKLKFFRRKKRFVIVVPFYRFHTKLFIVNLL